MDRRRKEPFMRQPSSGWVFNGIPAPVPQASEIAEESEFMMAPEPEAAQIPITAQAPAIAVPLPEPPVDGRPGEECGYCVTLAMAYIPMQRFADVYEAEEGFGRGTIFAELDLPFIGKGDCRYD